MGPSNEEMQLTKRGLLAGAPAGSIAARPAIFIESRFVADLRCSTVALPLSVPDDLCHALAHSHST